MEPEEEPLLRHFSHEHPLKRTNSPSSENIICDGCKLNILSSKDYYTCKTCPFSLHQVCFNMPKNIIHPADPNHNLTLLATPSLAKGSSKCKACGKNVTGFNYFCAKCGDHYHILCSVVPLSVTIPSHPHALNLEFSPPYDFECDLCSGPGFSGWLYRCGFCDFDVHLACAFSNRRAHSFRFQPVPLADLLARPSPTRIENNPFVDYSSKDNELLMQLMAIGFAGGKGESDGHDISQMVEGGRDDCEAKVRSGGNRGASELCQTKPDMADAHSRPRKLSEPSTPHSEDLTMSSFQFSDAYFSIDLAKTCPGDDLLNLQASPVPDNKETKSSGYIILPNRLYEPGFDPRSRGTENWQNGAISTGLDALIGKELGQESKRRKANGFREGSDIKDKSAESDMAGLRYCSCLSKLFFCCCT